MNNDPVLNTFSVFIHRVLIFFALWLLACGLIGYQWFGGAKTTWPEWWRLVSKLASQDWPSGIKFSMAFIAVAGALPTLMIFWIVGSWWRGRGIEALRNNHRDSK